MPQMDGWELAFHIKALKPEVPIVAFTGDSPDAILPRLPDSEINQALFKPLRIEVLGDAIPTILPSEGIKYASSHEGSALAVRAVAREKRRH